MSKTVPPFKLTTMNLQKKKQFQEYQKEGNENIHLIRKELPIFIGDKS